MLRAVELVSVVELLSSAPVELSDLCIVRVTIIIFRWNQKQQCICEDAPLAIGLQYLLTP